MRNDRKAVISSARDAGLDPSNGSRFVTETSKVDAPHRKVNDGRKGGRERTNDMHPEIIAGAVAVEVKQVEMQPDGAPVGGGAAAVVVVEVPWATTRAGTRRTVKMRVESMVR